MMNPCNQILLVPKCTCNNLKSSRSVEIKEAYRLNDGYPYNE